MIRQRERWCDYTAFWTADTADAPVAGIFHDAVAAVDAHAHAHAHAHAATDTVDPDAVRTLALTPVLDPQSPAVLGAAQPVAPIACSRGSTRVTGKWLKARFCFCKNN
jgi:hypothetical protein